MSIAAKFRDSACIFNIYRCTCTGAFTCTCTCTCTCISPLPSTVFHLNYSLILTPNNSGGFAKPFQQCSMTSTNFPFQCNMSLDLKHSNGVWVHAGEWLRGCCSVKQQQIHHWRFGNWPPIYCLLSRSHKRVIEFVVARKLFTTVCFVLSPFRPWRRERHVHESAARPGSIRGCASRSHPN